MDTPKTCRYCKWWGREYDSVCDAPQSEIIILHKGGDYPLPPEEKGLKDPTGFAIDARADDDQGLTANLVTGPNFGCVKFTPKE